MDGHGHVAGQRPRRGRPDQERGAGRIHQRQADEDRGIGGVFVAERHFMIRKRRAAARAVRYDFIALVEQTLIPEILQDPPDRLDVIVGIGDVGVFQVHPEGDAVSQLFPILDVGEDRFAAQFVEAVNAILLDLAFIGEAELLLDLDLDRQPVRVPAAAPRDVVAAHDLVAREHILESARQHVVDAGLAIGSRRPLEEDVLRSALSLCNGLLEDVLRLPEFQDSLLHRGYIEFGRNWFEHGSLLGK